MSGAAFGEEINADEPSIVHPVGGATVEAGNITVGATSTDTATCSLPGRISNREEGAE